MQQLKTWPQVQGTVTRPQTWPQVLDTVSSPRHIPREEMLESKKGGKQQEGAEDDMGKPSLSLSNSKTSQENSTVTPAQPYTCH